MEATIARYLEALETCGIGVDESVEKEMLQIIHSLTTAASPLTLPPAIGGPQVSAVQSEHTRELARVGSYLYREAANRLREVKIKARHNPISTHSAPIMSGSEPFTITSVAKTLAELKALPLADQALLLLRRLAHICPQVQGSGGLHKGNLLLPKDPYGLAMGFPDSENTPARTHLLGAPWTRLVNDGFLVDPPGFGFFSVSEEGFAMAKAAADPKLALAKAGADPNPCEDIPTVFVSYSWDSLGHKKWVLQLAERLVEGGVRVILDQWNLPPGADRTHFMEMSVPTSDFVLIVCTPDYATKANSRSGGVGYEAMIITSELAQRILQKKFIPVLRFGKWDGDGSSLPTWLQSKIGVDLRGDPYSEEQYEDLLRTLHQANRKPPPIGPKPAFSDKGPTERAANVVGAALASGASPASVDKRTLDEPQHSPIAYAFYETKGSDARRVQSYVRPTDATGESFRFETSTGESLEGTETQTAQRYLVFDVELRQKGYSRTHSFNGSGQIFNLP